MLYIEELNKYYGSFKAVDNLSLQIPKGEIFGFVGPNGAGKTTTMRIVCGLLDASSGVVQVDGIDARKDSRELKRKIGYMPDFFGVYDDLKVTEYMEFYASIYGIKGNDAKKITDDLLQLVDLSDKKEFYVDSLSRGMKQRLCLARSLVHNPELLVLDEPASGMDPRARIEMKNILRTLQTMGKTIILSSHILPELAELCTSIGIIEKGRMVINGSVDDIMRQIYGSRKLRLKVINDQEKTELLLKEMPLIESINSLSNGVIEFGFKGEDKDINVLLKNLVARDIPVVTIAELDGNLEDIFLKVTNGLEARS